jgi:hypothetical protein
MAGKVSTSFLNGVSSKMDGAKDSRLAGGTLSGTKAKKTKSQRLAVKISKTPATIHEARVKIFRITRVL